MENKAHELRTPLTAMIAGLCLLVDHAADLEPEQERFIALRCLYQAQKLAGVVDSILEQESGELRSLVGSLQLFGKGPP